MSETTYVEYSVADKVALIRLNRPDVMNSLNLQARSEFANAQAQAEADDAVRIVVLTGSGNSFSAGTDLKEVTDDLDSGTDGFDISVSAYKPLIDAITQSDKIYIAAINGFTGGVALGFAMGADLAIMSDKAVIFSPFANIGLVPDGGSSWFLLNSLGYKRAFSAIAECTRLDAKTCLEMGMVNKVVPDAELFEAAMLWASDLSAKSPLSLRYSKKILRAASTMSQQDTARLESEYQNKCLRSDDSAHAMRAFFNKEKPVFTGK